jgi:hypothetical protein
MEYLLAKPGSPAGSARREKPIIDRKTHLKGEQDA